MGLMKGTGGKMSNILVVDDQSRTLGAVTKLFERKGLTVLGAKDASKASKIFSQAVSKIYAVVIDLRLTDSTVGDLGGFELACRFREFNQYIPIFIYSASEIDSLVKDDDRINGTYRKGAKRSEGINVEEILSIAKTYWNDFHRDDPGDLIELKNNLKMDEDIFLRLIEPKTPLRHERIIDLLIEQKADEEVSQLAAEKDGWSFVDIERISLALDLSQSIFSELTSSNRTASEGLIGGDGTDFLRLTSFFSRAE